MSSPRQAESYYVASQWQLMRRKFRNHRLAVGGLVVLAIFYGVALFAEFFAQTGPKQYDVALKHHPPQRPRLFHEGRLQRPFVYFTSGSTDLLSGFRSYNEDRSRPLPIRLFVRGSEYRLLGLIPGNIHLFGVEEGHFFPFGTNEIGRDVYSLNVYAARVSLSVGFVGVLLSFLLGCILGGISGYYGGSVDMVIQRFIDFLVSLPQIPLWMAFAAVLPSGWTSIQRYFAITIILSIFGWAGLARVVRGWLLSTRQADFVLAARLAGAREPAVVVRHLLPSFLSYLIVSLTLSVPAMILGETALSFLGVGIRPPAVSWGTMLADAQNVTTLFLYPWLLVPGIFVIVAVLAFNFVGDGLRDAADPYK